MYEFKLKDNLPVLREYLGIIIDFKNNDLFTYRNKNIDFHYQYSHLLFKSISDLYQRFTYIKNKIDLCNNIYKQLIIKDKDWLNFPIYKNLWNFNVYSYNFKTRIDSQIYFDTNFENNESLIEMSCKSILDKIIMYQQSLTSSQRLKKKYYIKILHYQISINWDKIISSNQPKCPNCHCDLNFISKSCLIKKIKIYKTRNQYRITGLLHCKNCTVFDCPENKNLINKIDSTLVLLSNKLISKYYNKDIVIPKYYWYILETSGNHNKNDIINMLITFIQMKSFMKSKSNILFKLIIIYLI